MSRSASKIRTARTDANFSCLARSGDTCHSGQHHHGPSSLHAQRLSHEHHVYQDDKTLLEDAAGEVNLGDQQQQDLEHPLSEREDDLPLFSWDDETTLFHDLMEEGPRKSDEDRLDALVDSLQVPYGETRKRLKEEIAANFVPAMRHVKNLHLVLDERVDVTYAQGLKLFNSACKDLEAATLAEYQAIVETYEKTRTNIANLMEQLKAEYDHRDRLWLNLEERMNEIADSAIAEIQDTPAQVERTIAKLEKYCQSVDKDTKDSSAMAEKRIKELISKFG